MHYLLSRIKKACQVGGCHLNLTTEIKGEREGGIGRERGDGGRERQGERGEELQCRLKTS